MIRPTSRRPRRHSSPCSRQEFCTWRGRPRASFYGANRGAKIVNSLRICMLVFSSTFQIDVGHSWTTCAREFGRVRRTCSSSYFPIDGEQSCITAAREFGSSRRTCIIARCASPSHLSSRSAAAAAARVAALVASDRRSRLP